MPRTTTGRIPRPCAMTIVVCVLALCLSAVPAHPCRSSGNDVSADSAYTDSTTAAPGDSAAGSAASPIRPRISIVLEKGGRIVVELFPDQAPRAVERILTLVEEKFYDGLKFHRVESYLVQTGREDSELPPVEGEMFAQSLRHEVGMLGMARLPSDYDSATTQFYIMKERRPRLNGEYTLFGRVVDGMDRVRKIREGWKIERIAIVQ